MSLAARIADEKTFIAQRPGRRGGSMEKVFKQRSDERTADYMAGGSADGLSAASGLDCLRLG
jgi:ABC-type phosphate transport system ATPase subunit